VKVLKVTAVLILSVPMTLAIGVAYLFGSLIRLINRPPAPDPYEEGESQKVVRIHPKPEDRLWPF
jgi:hypothetical protein